MATERRDVPYRGRDFWTIVEARWAVFFHTAKRLWDYDHEAKWVLDNPQHYQPQFFLPNIGYLEVQHPDDHRVRHPLPHYHPEIEEHVIYLAVGDLPDERQLRDTGWWDPQHGQGVKNLTPGDGWEAWFPPDSPEVLQAIEVARTKEFTLAIPLERQLGEEVRDISERERDQSPE